MLGKMAVGYRIVTVLGVFVFLIHTNPATSIGDFVGGIDPSLSHGLPTYLIEPENNYYIVKHKPVTLVCAAHGAAQIIFRCAGQWVREKRHVNLELLDPVTGIKYMQTSIDVIREEVEEYFGLDGYWCECHAWGKVGGKSDAKISKRGIVQVAYLRKRFQREPISTRVEIHTTVQLQCLPPDGLPTPKVFWIKNGKPLNVKNDINYIISNEGNLIINQARLSDMGNYTCGAQNAASRRLSELAKLTVYVNGGWSTWSQWTECSAKCGKGLQRRTRTCSNPEPRNEGAPCSGESSQRNPCTSICRKDGGWSSWSSWSTCSPDCVHYRRRDCDSPHPGSGGQYCHGTDLATSNCTGGMCRGFYNSYNGNPKPVRNGNQADLGVNPNLARKSQSEASKKDDGDNIALYVGLSVAFAVFITIGIIIIYLVRRRHYQQPGVYDMDIPSSDLNTPTMDEDEKKVNKNGQDMMSIQPDLMQTVVQLRSPMSDMSNSPNNNHLDSSDKFHIYAEPNENRLSGSYGKNSSTYKILDVDPNNVMSHSLKSNVDKLTMKDKAALQISTPSDHRPLLGCDTDIVSSQQFYMAAQLPQNIAVEAIAWNTFDYKGGRLVIAEAGVSLTVPEGAIPKGHREQLYMAVCRDDKDRPRLSDTQTILSPIIQCGSQSQLLKKPVILSFPHCASMRQGGWMLTVCSSDVRVEEPPQWRVAVVLGQETLNTPLYTQLDPHHCHLMTENLVRYTLIGESAPGGRAIKILRLAAFAPTTPGSMDFSIRVYVVEDTQDALEGVFQIERNLGGRLLDKPKQILFQDGGNNLCLTIEEMSHGWRSKLAASYQEIPFWHIWSGNQNNLHCSFSLELVDRNEQSLSCLIQVYQKAILSNRQVLHINTNIKEPTLSLSSQSTLQRQKPVAVSTNASTGFGSVAMLEPTTLGFRISSGARNHLCLLLDPPNARGNDWRMLAQALTVDRYINYFASKPSPTEHILDLWEARHREESALTDLMNILRVMGRMDASAVLEKDLGPWL